MSLPNRLRVRNGHVVMDDGSSIQAYLKPWVAKHGLTDDTPVVLVDREELEKLRKAAMPKLRAIYDERFALAG